MSETTTTVDAEALQTEIYAVIERFANSVGNLLVRETVKVIDENDVRASADLRKSITYEVKLFGTFVVITVFSPLNYAFYAHEGRKPGRMPPIEPIQRWVHQKRASGRFKEHPTTAVKYGKGVRRLGGKLNVYNQDRSTAFAIAMAIAKKGTKGVKFFDMALKQALPKIERQLRAV